MGARGQYSEAAGVAFGTITASANSRTGGFPITSTANAKGAGRRFDFNVALVLGARSESERAARALNNNGAGTFAWIIHKLVEFGPVRTVRH